MSDLRSCSCPKNPANKVNFQLPQNCHPCLTSRPKIRGSPPKPVKKTESRKYTQKMWDPSIPYWHLYRCQMADGNPRSYPPQEQQQQQQQLPAFMSPYSLGQQTCPYVPHQQQPSAPYYYAPVPPQPDCNAPHTYISPAQAWLDYQTKQQQCYSYWYQPTPQTACNPCQRTGLNQGDFGGFGTPNFSHSNRNQDNGYQRCQPPRAQARASSGGWSQPELYPQLESGSLNRIDSVSSFRNQRGSRIRNSEHDMIEYHRIAARKLKRIEKQQERDENLPNQRMRDQQCQLEPDPVEKMEQIEMQVDENRMEPSRIGPGSQNIVISEAVETRSNSFFQKLGLFKRSVRRRQIRRQSHPCHSPSSSEETVECYPRKKPNFFKRLFGGSKCASNLELGQMETVPEIMAYGSKYDMKTRLPTL